jgi:RND family efflux transporter MFP subunit
LKQASHDVRFRLSASLLVNWAVAASQISLGNETRSATAASNGLEGFGALMKTTHPRQGLFGQKSVISFLIFVFVLQVGGCSRSQQAKAGSDGSPIEVRVHAVEQRVVRRPVQAVGSLYALEESTVSAEVEGRVERVLADVGDTVQEGQVLVTLSPVELQYEVQRQQAAVQQVRARLGIGPGDPLPRTPDEVAFVQRAAAEFFEAQQNYNRAQQLHRDQLISQQQLDEAATRFKAARAAHELALQEVEQLKAQLKSSEAALALAEKKLADASIRAPFPGAVKQRRVSPGEFVRVQTPVAVIVRTDRLRARLDVPEKWASAVTTGLPVELRLEAYPGEVFSGHVVRINPAVNAETRSFEVEALIPNPDGRLKPGFFVQATLSSELEEKILTIPESAVYYRYGIYKVYVVNGDRVEEREIQAGGRFDGRLEVTGGVSAGERIAEAVSGVLQHGAAVRAVAAANAAPGQD